MPDITAGAVHQGNFARRQPNALQYWSPAWRGLQARVSYAAGAARSGASNPYDYGASLSLADSRSYMALAFEKHHDQAGALVQAGREETGYGIAAFHRYGPLKIEGQLGSYARTGTQRQRSYALGFEWSPGVAPHATLLGIYQRVRHGGAGDLPAQPHCRV